MAAFERFEDIEAWQVARDLVKAVYATTTASAFGPDGELRGQLTRAALSVMTNIAEGFGRGNDGDFIRFLDIARGSATEIQSLLYVGVDIGYVSDQQATFLRTRVAGCISLIAGLQSYLRRSRRQR